ncbi:putative 2-aminoethylphosphonate transport system permease protein PhnV [compost metagenome]
MIRTMKYHHVLISLLLLYLLMPLLVTGLYAFAGKWTNTLLPETWTLEWFRQIALDARFLHALWNSFWLCAVSVLLSLVIMLPTVFVVTVYFPRWEFLLKSTVVLPYAVPGIVAAVGLIRAYSSGPLAISGTAYILIGAYFVAILPYMYQGLRNSLLTLNASSLLDAAEMLGASKLAAFRTVILPNIMPGVTVSMLLSFSVLFGEFVLTNMLVGGQIETVQIYLYKRLSESGHLASTMAILYFTLILIISLGLTRIGQFMKGGIRL